MRTAVCIIATIIYSIAIIVYLFYQSDPSIAYGTRKVMFYIPTTVMLLFYKIIRYDKYRVCDVCFFAVICSFIIIILNFAGLITNTYNLMYAFLGLIIAISTIVLIAGKHHGYFKNE